MAEQLQVLARAKDRLEGLFQTVATISRLETSKVLRSIVTTATDLVGARYGALAVLDEDGEGLAQFIPVGLSEAERADLTGLEFPCGRGLLGQLLHHPAPLRIDDIPSHPIFVGFPPGHPPMHALLGAAIRVREKIYGDLYLCDRRDGRPFDASDEDLVVALAGLAGIAIENARLHRQVHDSTEQFQRLLLPQSPQLRPCTGAAIYRPASNNVGGDWYDTIKLPGHTCCAAVVGDVVGHDLRAAAAMASTRNMLRALVFYRCTSPSAVLTQLDRTLQAITDNPVTTACLVCIDPGPDGSTLRWSTAGHLPPLLVTPDGRARYLHTEPGLPLGVDTVPPRPEHTRFVPFGSTLVLFTDGLIEHRDHPAIDWGMNMLADLAIAHADLPPHELVQALADQHPGDGRDDMVVLAIRTPREQTGELCPMCGERGHASEMHGTRTRGGTAPRHLALDALSSGRCCLSR